MDNPGIHVMTIANSIIGVSILAMPYCFKQCGILLSILMLILSSIISRLACHFLLKSAIKARLRTFEFLAYHAFGPLGKFVIEIGMIGFLLGTCIAFFVVMGDLGPQIVANLVGIKTTNTLRTSILVILAIFCILPLGLLRNVDSLSGVCTATIGFYICLVLKIMGESAPHILVGDWYDKVEFWRSDGVLQCIPIFSMALFCQTQLFEIYQAIPNASLERMNSLIRVAVNICTSVYIFVGIFGYIALSNESFSGNVLMSFKPSFMTELMKMGFVLSVAFSFPLIVFPCRASLFSLLYKPTYVLHDSGTNYIPEGKFRLLTVFIVSVSLVIGILIPNIELVLGLVGSTIGVMICVLFPATCFICVSKKNTNERILAQIMLFIGIIVMVLGTYANLYAIEEIKLNSVTEKIEVIPFDIEANVMKNAVEHKELIMDIPITRKSHLLPEVIKDNLEPKLDKKNKIVDIPEILKEVRHEPPQPVEPEEVVAGNFKEIPKADAPVENNKEPNEPMLGSKTKGELTIEKKEDKVPDVAEKVIPDDNNSKVENNLKPELDKVLVKNALESSVAKEVPLENQVYSENGEVGPPEVKIAGNVHADQVDIEAIKKEEKEMNQQEKEKRKEFEDTNLDIIGQLQKQSEVLVQEQKKILEEMKQRQEALRNDKQSEVLVQEQKKVLQEMKQRQEALINEQEKNEIDKLKEEKLKAVKEIEAIAKQAIKDLVDEGIKPQISDEIKIKPALLNLSTNLSQVNNEKVVKKPAPLSYQIGFNLSDPSNLPHQQSLINMDKLIPIPMAKSNNLSLLANAYMNQNNVKLNVSQVSDTYSDSAARKDSNKIEDLKEKNNESKDTVIAIETVNSNQRNGIKMSDNGMQDSVASKLIDEVKKENADNTRNDEIIDINAELKVEKNVNTISLKAQAAKQNSNSERVPVIDIQSNDETRPRIIEPKKDIGGENLDGNNIEDQRKVDIQEIRRDILSQNEILNRSRRDSSGKESENGDTCEPLKSISDESSDEKNKYQKMFDTEELQKVRKEHVVTEINKIDVSPKIIVENKLGSSVNNQKDTWDQKLKTDQEEEGETKETHASKVQAGSLLKLVDKLPEHDLVDLNLGSFSDHQHMDPSRDGISIYKNRKK